MTSEAKQTKLVEGSPLWRKVLRRYYGGYRMVEIAAELGVGLPAIKAVVNRHRQMMDSGEAVLYIRR